VLHRARAAGDEDAADEAAVEAAGAEAAAAADAIAHRNACDVIHATHETVHLRNRRHEHSTRCAGSWGAAGVERDVLGRRRPVDELEFLSKSFKQWQDAAWRCCYSSGREEDASITTASDDAAAAAAFVFVFNCL
jgi:hypothetical protein